MGMAMTHQVQIQKEAIKANWIPNKRVWTQMEMVYMMIEMMLWCTRVVPDLEAMVYRGEDLDKNE